MPTTEPNPLPKATISLVVHADAKVGKTWLAATGPRPILVCDAEGGTRFIPKLRKVIWDPAKTEPPDMTDKDMCVVYVRKYDTLLRVQQWLNSGRHPFRSFAIDSLTDVQKRCMDRITGGPDRAPEQQDWGELLRHMEQLVRELRDLTFHPTRPLECVIITALTHFRDGKFRPMVKGQLEITLPSIPDVVGQLRVVATDQADGTTKMERRLAIQPLWPQLLAGDRTHVLTQKLGPDIARPNLSKMLTILEENETDGT